MKKIATLAFSLIFATTISGCGAQNSSGEERNESTTTTTTTAVTTTVATTKKTEEHVTTTTTAVTTTAATTTTTAEPVVDVSSLEKVKLDIKNIQMEPELPKGSSIVSATIALNYYGIECDKMDLLNYMNVVTEDKLWGDPHEMYIGNPTDESFVGFCYSSVIKRAIEDYWSTNNITTYEIIDLEGADPKDLYTEVANGNPVIVWCGTYMTKIRYGYLTLQLNDGNEYDYPMHNHTVCLVGFDNKHDKVFVCDPLQTMDIYEYSKEEFENSFKSFDSQALVIHRK